MSTVEGRQTTKLADQHQQDTSEPDVELARDGGGNGSGPPVLPRLGPRGWLRWGWRQLTSMRTALLLLMLLAIAAVPGSVFPQRRIDPGRVQSYLSLHPSSGPTLDRLGAFDVYGSPWFSAIYLLLFVSLVGCLLPRTRQHLKQLRAAPPRTPRRLERLPAHVTGTVDAEPEQALAAARRVLRRRRYRVAEYPGSVAAERGQLCETGNLVFHLSLVGLLIAIAAGSFVAWEGQAIVVTGDSFADTPPLYDSFKPGRSVDASDLPPFSFKLDSMRVVFESQLGGNQFAAARTFEAEVSYQKAPGDPMRRKRIEVNHPLNVDGAKVFLLGNGYAPEVTVTDGTGKVAFSGPVPFLPRDGFYTSVGVVKVPDAKPRQLGLAGFLLPTAVLQANGQPVSVFPDLRNPRLVITAYAGDLGMNDGPPQSVYALDTSKLTQLMSSPTEAFSKLMAPGDTVTLPNGAGSVRFDGVRRYAALEVRADPSKGWVLLFAVLALAGLTLSLFVRRRRVWVRADSQPDGRTLVQVAGLSRVDDAGLVGEVESLLGELTLAGATLAGGSRSAASPSSVGSSPGPREKE